MRRRSARRAASARAAKAAQGYLNGAALTPPLTCIEPEIPQPVKPSPRRRTQSYRAYGEDDDAGIGSAARVKRIK